MTTKLEFGEDHARKNGATHQRDGAIYKVEDGKVMYWDCGSWSLTKASQDIDDKRLMG